MLCARVLSMSECRVSPAAHSRLSWMLKTRLAQLAACAALSQPMLHRLDRLEVPRNFGVFGIVADEEEEPQPPRANGYFSLVLVWRCSKLVGFCPPPPPRERQRLDFSTRKTI